MRARKAVRVLMVAGLIIALATPAFADWQSLGWAFFGLAAFNSAVVIGTLAKPMCNTPAPVNYAPPPVSSSPPPGVFYPSGSFYRPAPYGYYYRKSEKQPQQQGSH